MVITCTYISHDNIVLVIHAPLGAVCLNILRNFVNIRLGNSNTIIISSIMTLSEFKCSVLLLRLI